ncbi:hypothetical protein H5410_021857, partial [Solanum commersonii]
IYIESLFFFLVLVTLDEFCRKVWFNSIPHRWPHNQLIDSAAKSLNINLWGILSVNHRFWCHIPFCSLIMNCNSEDDRQGFLQKHTRAISFKD